MGTVRERADIIVAEFFRGDALGCSIPFAAGVQCQCERRECRCIRDPCRWCAAGMGLETGVEYDARNETRGGTAVRLDILQGGESWFFRKIEVIS